MAATSFYDEISKNKLKSYLLFVLFGFIVILLGIVFGLYFAGSFIFGAILAFIIVITYSLVSYYSGDKMILSISRAREVTKKEDPYLVNTVEGLAIAAGIPKPKVYIINEESMNAFATGRDPQHASVAVTSGLRKRMNRLELEGVLAHEISHIKNYDIRLMLLAAVLIGVVVMISDIMLRSFLWGGMGGRGRSRDGGGGSLVIILVALALAILAPIVAQLIRLAISRKREFLADASAAKLTRYPKGLADALKKIKNDHDVVVDTANKATAHLYIENPLRNRPSWLNSLFSTHPPIDKRISILESM
jgi:heat shock protein HtpX